eukprot:gnl/Chilomastix_cuspidata/2957.p1 GENE.gnl/Chilomastix_cuspidata/2957~~gnl/Chilomastix_cuspidata/2957.p1  ORF type:complete len:454 (+),score=153.26 gnl/Chilomastix_cuspidata/2957:239-1600(+)
MSASPQPGSELRDDEPPSTPQNADMSAEGSGSLVYQDASAPVTREFQKEVPVDEMTTVPVHVRYLEFPSVSFGGYRNTKTGIEYYHASSQTDVTLCHWRRNHYFALSRGRMYSPPEKKTRDTQTAETRQQYIEMPREVGTQPPRPDLLPDADEGRKMVGSAQRYEPSEKYLVRAQRAAVLVQSWWRGILARRVAATLRAERAEEERRLEEERRAEQQRLEEEHEREIERRMHPKTRADFEILYSELAEWVSNQTWEINDAGLPEPARLAALSLLLDKETKLLQAIDRLKIEAAHENKASHRVRFLDRMSKPKLWTLSDGSVAETHTPYTLRARDLYDLYTLLETPLPVDDRLECLLRVKSTVREFDCQLTREIVELIDREADLVQRSRPMGALKGLRVRLTNLFFQFCETPEFNPAAYAEMKTPADMIRRPNTLPLYAVPLEEEGATTRFVGT